MAKKNKSVAAKKTTKARASKKTPVSKKPPASKANKRAARATAEAKPKSRGNSVDTLLRNFEKVRKSQESKLASSLKKIDELELKSTKLQEQIVKLKETAAATQADIDQLDTRRDSEVAEVLAKLGVQLSSGKAPAEPLPKLTFGGSSDSDEEITDED